MRISVVGGGRMGLPLACMFAEHGASVLVCDVNPDLVASINAGFCPYEEPGLPELVAKLQGAGRLQATTDTARASSESNAIVVIVPAHLTDEREIDFSILQAASSEVGKGLQRGALVVYETTVAVGGTRRCLIPVLEKHSGLTAGQDFFVAFSPERVKANLVLARLQGTPKVVGGLDSASCAKAVALYTEYLGAPVDDVGPLEAAEMAKLIGMLYRDVNIALANELAAFCEVAGVDFERVRTSANTDGEANLLEPGIGVGGHCVPVYPYFLTRESRRLGIAQRISEAAREVNDRQPARELERVTAVFGSLSGQNVHILGLGFRPGVKVDTFSPAYSLRDELLQRGAVVTIEDPNYTEAELRKAGFVPGVADVASFVVLSTAHEEFTHPNFAAWRTAGVKVVLDGRNLWNQKDAEAAGILYFGIGRPSRAERQSQRRLHASLPPSRAEGTPAAHYPASKRSTSAV